MRKYRKKKDKPEKSVAMLFSSNRRRISKIMEIISGERNLFLTGKGFFSYPELHGETEAGYVKITKSVSDNDGMTITIIRSLNFKGAITINEETPLLKIKKVLGESDILTGDTPFDEAFLIQAHKPYVAHAILTEKVREILFSLTKFNDLELTNLYLQYSVPLRDIQAVEDLTGPLDTGNSLYMALLHDGNQSPIIRCKKRLLNNILHDPVAEVRRKNIIMAGAHLKTDTEVRGSLLKAMTGDPDFRNRYEAALLLGETGLDYMMEMLEKNIDDTLKCDIVRSLREEKHIKSITYLKKFCPEQAPSVRDEIIKTLLVLEKKPDLPFYARYLQFMEQNACLSLLALYEAEGDLASVEHLYRISKESSNSTLRNAAHHAMTMIQSRLGEGDKGWLSVVDSQKYDGALSINNGPSEKNPLPEKTKQEIKNPDK
jgi:hypothetical protein